MEIDSNLDELLGKTLVSLKGQEWRQMRATLSPAFSGSKLRQMFKLIQKSNENSIQTLNERITLGGEVLEMKDFFTNFTIDVIATCAFGLEVNSTKNPENDFKKIAMKTLNPNLAVLFVKIFSTRFLPYLLRKLNFGFFDQQTKNFFRSTILDTIKYREAAEISRPDMINLLMDARKGKLKRDTNEEIDEGFATTEESNLGKVGPKRDLDDDDLVAQCLIFFLGGKISSD